MSIFQGDGDYWDTTLNTTTGDKHSKVFWALEVFNTVQYVNSNNREGYMNINIRKVNVTVDYVTLTSNDRRFIIFDHKVMDNYKTEPRVPITKETEENDGEEKAKRADYKHLYVFRHKETKNEVHILEGRPAGSLYHPNLTVRFYSSWEHPLSYEEVVELHNCLGSAHGIGFNLAEFHVAVDLFSDVGDDYFEYIVGHTQAGRIIDPEPHPEIPRLYHFHSKRSDFRLTAYDKAKQLLEKKRCLLSVESIEQLEKENVVRLESRFNNTRMGIVPSLEDLATSDFSFIYPQHIKFLKPRKSRIRKVGLGPRDYRGLSLAELRDLLVQNGVKHNFQYYLKHDRELGKLVKKALKEYRWCGNPEQYPLAKPEAAIPRQGVSFKRHK